MTTSKEKAFELKNAGYPQPLEPAFGQKYWHDEYGEMVFIEVVPPNEITKLLSVGDTPNLYLFSIKNHTEKFCAPKMSELIKDTAFAPTPTEIMEQLPKEVDGVVCLYSLRINSGRWYLETKAAMINSGKWYIKTNEMLSLFNFENPADICADAYLYFKRIFKRPYIDILKDDIEKPKMQ